MGRLVEVPLRTLFGGVSRQPHNVRLPNQVEEADNVNLSVVTGGFEKRYGTEHVKKLTGVAKTLVAHMIDRDAVEKYIVLFLKGDLKVFDLQGNAATVNFPDGKNYLNNDPEKMVAVTIADYTIVANKDVTVEMDAPGSATVYGPANTFGDLPLEGVKIPAYLGGDDDATWQRGVTSGYKNGDIWKVTNAESQLDDYYVKYDATADEFRECANPNEANSFKDNTLPWQLTRDSLSPLTFTFKKATYKDREVGDNITVPPPDFVGKKIEDLIFHRNRFGLLSDEHCIFSQAGDYLNFWPDSAVEAYDSDPVFLTASTNRVSILKYAVPFRKALFVTAARVQFEISGDNLLTPRTAAIDPATTYEAAEGVRPITMGDELYFASATGSEGVVFEYYYDDETLTNTAADVTKHCKGYIKADIVEFAADPTTGTLFVRTDDDPESVYVYTTYWNDTDKVQSAWGRWTFGDEVLGMGFLNRHLYLLMDRSDGVYIERVAVTAQTPTKFSFNVRLDRQTFLTGSYDAGTNLTTWTVPYDHGNAAKVILSEDFPNQEGRDLNVQYPSSTTITAVGDFSGGDALVGLPYTMRVELSRQFVRMDDGTTITNGRCQMRYLYLTYRDTGYCEVVVTPEGRPSRTLKFIGFVLGGPTGVVGKPYIAEAGTFPVRVRSRSDTVKIEIKSASHLPATITSAVWTGYFNEVTRQG